MATKNIVPNADSEGGIGTSSKYWATGFIDAITTTGNLVIGGSIDLEGAIDVNGTTNLDIVDIDGAVNMATTALVTGVLTTTAATVFNGGFTSNAASTISTADNLDTLSLISTDADANAGPNLRLFRNSASPADADVVGLVEFEGKNSAGTTVRWAGIESKIVDVTDSTEDGSLELVTTLAGSGAVSRILMNATETVINESSKDLDFRVESDNLTDAFFVQGSDGFVGIGTSPGQKVVVGGGTNGRVRIKVDEAENNFGKFDFSTSDSATSSATMIAEITANITSAASSALTSELIFSTNSGDSLNTGLTISSGGLLTVKDDLIIKTGGTIGGASDPDLLTLSSNELEITGANNVNTRMILTSPGVSNTVLGFNKSGGTVNGVVNNASYLGNLQAYPLVFITNGGVALTLDASKNATIAGALTVSGGGNSAFSGPLFISNSSGDSLTLTKATTEPSFRIEGDSNKDFVITISGELLTFTQNDGTTDILTLDHDTKNVTITDGNLIIGTAGHGITFSSTNTPAQSNGSGSSNTLDDYEEGTWTGTMSNTGLTTTATGTYVRIGDLVYIQIYFADKTINNAGNAIVTGLPFSANVSQSLGYSVISYIHGTSILNCKGGYVAATAIYNTIDNSSGQSTWVTGSGKFGMWGGTYRIN